METPKTGSLRGVVGRLQWAYYTAAAINGYTVTFRHQAWRLTATVVQHDAFQLSQRPLVFVAPHERGEWRWPVRHWRVNGGDVVPARAPFQLTADLDPPDTHTTQAQGSIYVVSVRATGDRPTGTLGR